MTTEEVAITTAIAQTILALAAIVSSTIVSICVYIGTKRLAVLEHARSIRDAWVAIDGLALSNDETLRIADGLHHPELCNQTIDEMRTRWFAFALLNALVSTLNGAKRGLIDKPKEAEEGVKSHLRMILHSDAVYAITQAPGYDQDLSRLAKEVKSELLASNITKQAEQGVAPQPPARSESDFSGSLPPLT